MYVQGCLKLSLFFQYCIGSCSFQLFWIGFNTIFFFNQIFLNSLPINYYPWLYMISIGERFGMPHIYANFAMVIAILLSYCIITNHPVTGFIIVTVFSIRFFLFPFLGMVQGPIRSTQSLFRGIYSDKLSVNLPFLYLTFLYVDKCHNSQLMFSYLF